MKAGRNHSMAIDLCDDAVGAWSGITEDVDGTDDVDSHVLTKP